MCGLEPEVPEEIVLLRRIIDFVLTQFSWSFMLVILAAGIWCSAVAGRTGPIHVGAPRDTTGLDMTAAAPRNGGSSTLQQLLVPPASAVLAPKRDLALEELQDEPAAWSLTLPRADEQARQQALQELEDELLISDGLFSLTGADPFSGFRRFIFIFTFFHFPAKKSVHMGEVGSDPRAGYFFQRSSVPPRSPLHYQLENGGAITFMRYRLNGYTPRTRTTHAAHARTLSEDKITCVRLNATGV